MLFLVFLYSLQQKWNYMVRFVVQNCHLVDFEMLRGLKVIQKQLHESIIMTSGFARDSYITKH